MRYEFLDHYNSEEHLNLEKSASFGVQYPKIERGSYFVRHYIQV